MLRPWESHEYVLAAGEQKLVDVEAEVDGEGEEMEWVQGQTC